MAKKSKRGGAGQGDGGVVDRLIASHCTSMQTCVSTTAKPPAIGEFPDAHSAHMITTLQLLAPLLLLHFLTAGIRHHGF
jgi:hypothetical protein